MEEIFVTPEILKYLNLDIIRKVEYLNKELGDECTLKYIDIDHKLVSFYSEYMPFDTLQDLKHLLYTNLHEISPNFNMTGLSLTAEVNKRLKETIRKIDAYARLQSMPVNEDIGKFKSKI